VTAGTALSQRLAERCAADGEFCLFARYWTGTLRFVVGADVIELAINDGVPSAGEPAAAAATSTNGPEPAGTIVVTGPSDVWDQVLAPVPAPFFNDITPAQAFGLRQQGEPETLWQYFPAVRRAVDLLRLDRNG
jgi:hypothetical protein